MGANLARHLKDKGYTIGGVFDVRAEAAQELAAELGCTAVIHPGRTHRLRRA